MALATCSPVPTRPRVGAHTNPALATRLCQLAAQAEPCHAVADFRAKHAGDQDRDRSAIPAL